MVVICCWACLSVILPSRCIQMGTATKHYLLCLPAWVLIRPQYFVLLYRYHGVHAFTKPVLVGADIKQSICPIADDAARLFVYPPGTSIGTKDTLYDRPFR